MVSSLCQSDSARSEVFVITLSFGRPFGVAGRPASADVVLAVGVIAAAEDCFRTQVIAQESGLHIAESTQLQKSICESLQLR